MTRTFGTVRRIAAFCVVATLFAAPVASAQSPAGAVSPNEAPPSATLLSNAAFARLVQPARAEDPPARVGADSPRPSLLRQATVAMPRLAPTMATPRQQQRSWVARHKVATGVLIGLGAFFGGYFIWYGHDCAPHNDCFS